MAEPLASKRSSTPCHFPGGGTDGRRQQGNRQTFLNCSCSTLTDEPTAQHKCRRPKRTGLLAWPRPAVSWRSCAAPAVWAGDRVRRGLGAALQRPGRQAPGVPPATLGGTDLPAKAGRGCGAGPLPPGLGMTAGRHAPATRPVSQQWRADSLPVEVGPRTFRWRTWTHRGQAVTGDLTGSSRIPCRAVEGRLECHDPWGGSKPALPAGLGPCRMAPDSQRQFQRLAYPWQDDRTPACRERRPRPTEEVANGRDALVPDRPTPTRRSGLLKRAPLDR